jgi:hypothetical protein
MIQTYDPRPHKWIALTYERKFICAAKKLAKCIQRAKDKGYKIDEIYTTVGVEEDYTKS